MHTERGAALSVAAAVDEELSTTLKKHMIDSSLKPAVFREGQPLGNFGIKIRIAYLLGIVSKPLFQEPEVVREIRNKFVHREEIRDFHHQEIVDLCNKLWMVADFVKHPAYHNSSLKTYDLTQNSYKFIATCGLLQSAITIEGEHARVRKPHLNF